MIIVWMRLGTSRIAHGFLQVDLSGGFDKVEPAAGCDRFPVAELQQDDHAERCRACLRAIQRLQASDAVQDAQTRLASALGVLAADEWVITPVPGTVTATREWSDRSRDTVIVLGPDSAHARRDDAAGALVWHIHGAVEDVTRAAQALAPPKSQEAPANPIGPV